MDPIRLGPGCSMTWQPRTLGWLVVLLFAGSEPLHATDDRPTLAAIRATGSIRIDGRLDEPDWPRAPIANGFRKIEPVHGAPASAETEVRILFDNRHLYVGIVAHDPEGAAGIQATSMARDFDFYSNDLVGIALDPFRDQRNAIGFQVNPYGAQRDVLAFDDVLFDRDWNGAWSVRTTISDSGWIAEIAIPWSTLRYPREGAGEWGLQFVRLIRRLNEESGWTPWPRGASNNRMEYAGALVGLEPPPPSRNLRLQPYATTRALESRLPGATERDFDPDGGGDLKWAVTPNTVLDLTVNTDFGEAEVDRQVVNLGRFPTLFPERRQFFLESASLFETGRVTGLPLRPFYSRRIGLEDGRPVPIDVGARLVHRTVDRSAGLLIMRQRATATAGPAGFGVVRLSQNVGAGNRLGTAVIHREDGAHEATAAQGNTVGVVDGLLRLGASGRLQGMWSASTTTGNGGEGTAGYLWLSSNSSRGYFGWIQEYASPGYVAASGFLPRRNYVWSSPAATLDLRPGWRPASVRRFNPAFVLSIYHDLSPVAFREGWFRVVPLSAELNNGGEIQAWIRREWQRLDRPFAPLPGVSFPTGRYTFTLAGATYRPNTSRPYWAWVTLAAGSYYDGSRQQVIYRASPLPGPRIRLTLDYEGNRFRGLGPTGENLMTHLVSGMVSYTPTPSLDVSTYYEYHSVSRIGVWNARVAWEFRPLSYLYVVFNDRRPAADPNPLLNRPQERQLLLKLTWLGLL
jgi:hypothetical protein